MKTIFNKSVIIALALLFIVTSIFAQTPQKMSYQAVIRNNSNELITNLVVGIKISILQGSITGNVVYAETHQPIANTNGLVSIEIGGGTIISGLFTSINWANGPFFIQTETDPLGGTNYSIVGTSQLLSVPYSMYAEKAGSILVGGTNGQVLTNCNGIPTWTTGGQCPTDGMISSLDCNSINIIGSVTLGVNANGVNISIPYIEGNGGHYNGLIIYSTGVLGLSASITSGTFSVGNGTLTFNITGTANTSGNAYFLINIGGQSCTVQLSVSNNGGITSIPGSGVIHYGVNYGSIILGNGQEWMSQNLKTEYYANGDPIPNVTDNNAWNFLNTGAWVVYNDNSVFENSFGKLYNWFTVSDPRNVCPNGWHVPSNDEWIILKDYLGGFSVAGGKLKSTSNWEIPNTGATNLIGFNGLPGGWIDSFGMFDYVGFSGDFWTSTGMPGTSGSATATNLSYFTSEAAEYDVYKNYGLSIRCVKD
jgi:uncharacterized protein (TIGR02145 family)